MSEQPTSPTPDEVESGTVSADELAGDHEDEPGDDVPE
jgi:hypothetical protein